jgi:CUB domain
MGKYCGTALPPASTTTENVMTLTFSTDVSSAKLGFSALVTFIEGSKGRLKGPSNFYSLSRRARLWLFPLKMSALLQNFLFAKTAILIL